MTSEQADRIEAKLDRLLEIGELLLLAELAYDDDPDDLEHICPQGSA